MKRADREEETEALIPSDAMHWWCTLQETNISPKNGILKMIFLFPRWDMLIPWMVFVVSIRFIFFLPW